LIGKVQCVVVDCPNALELAHFYQILLGGMVNQPDPRWAVSEEFVTLHSGSGLIMAFQKIVDHQPPRWPEPGHPQQFHLDIDVADLDAAQQTVLEAGGKLLHADPRGWRVFADPAGHPFCLLRG
jgi:predicted enzyme related to lactoylglutathione lyase